MVLFRLLFVAYAEDKDLLPYRTNGAYADHSLKTSRADLANERTSSGWEDVVFDENATDLWDDVAALWTAVDKGERSGAYRAYNGGLFSSDADVNAAGAALASCQLTNAEFGPALARTARRRERRRCHRPGRLPQPLGPRVRHDLRGPAGVEPRRSRRATSPLDSDGTYVPAGERATRSSSREGEVYFHNRSGARKATRLLLHEAVRRRAPARPRARAGARRPPRRLQRAARRG